MWNSGHAERVLVNDRMETNVPGVYAIGDVVGKAMLAHVASAQGKVAAENFLGHPRTIDYDVIPTGIFTLPEIGRVGLTEQQARDRCLAAGKDPQQALKIGRFRYGGLGKAQATGDIQGLVKVIAETETDRILGAHILGAHATDLIHEAALAMHVGATVSRRGRHDSRPSNVCRRPHGSRGRCPWTGHPPRTKGIVVWCDRCSSSSPCWRSRWGHCMDRLGHPYPAGDPASDLARRRPLRFPPPPDHRRVFRQRESPGRRGATRYQSLMVSASRGIGTSCTDRQLAR